MSKQMLWRTLYDVVCNMILKPCCTLAYAQHLNKYKHLFEKFNACFRLSTPTSNYWRVNASNIHWGNQTILSKPGSAVFDSGTTGIELTTEQWQSLHEVSHKHLTGATRVICYKSFHMLCCVSYYTCRGVWIA